MKVAEDQEEEKTDSKEAWGIWRTRDMFYVMIMVASTGVYIAVKTSNN